MLVYTLGEEGKGWPRNEKGLMTPPS